MQAPSPVAADDHPTRGVFVFSSIKMMRTSDDMIRHNSIRCFKYKILCATNSRFRRRRFGGECALVHGEGQTREQVHDVRREE